MPVYNKQNYIQRSLDSVLNQDFLDYELIVVDDGSTDNSLKILEEYQSKDSRITVIHTENHGVSHARNVGLEHINGEWVQFLDGDDYIDKKYLNNVQSVINDVSIDIIFSSFYKVNEVGEVLDTVKTEYTDIQSGEKLLDSFLQYQWKNGYYGFISNKLMRRRLIERTNARFNENLRLAEDLDFFAQMYPAVNVSYYTDNNSFYYLQTDDSLSKDQDIDYLGQLEIQKRIRQWAIDAGAFVINKDTVDGQVCRYAAYAVFDAAMKNRDIASICNTLLNDEVVNQCLNSKYVSNPVHKRIISAMQKKDIHKLDYYLRTREAIKKILGRR
ncbi:MAG: glycosyltransferase family 2 protein [Solobacterium sp.]|nr:glycosyltransferase family 2 protein [Solobacterium sp.]